MWLTKFKLSSDITTLRVARKVKGSRTSQLYNLDNIKYRALAATSSAYLYLPLDLKSS